jgi:DNA-binding PadR family transcriptional regulator
MSLDLAILGFLNEHPRSGYDLKTQCFRGPVGTFWTADQAQIYRTLERLRSARLVAATRKRQASRPDRRVYEITRSGRETLLQQLGETAPLPRLRDPFLVQLYFAADLDDDALLSVLQARRDAHQVRLNELRQRSAELAGTAGGTAQRAIVLQQTALDGAISQHCAAIDWLDECLDAVRAGALPGSETGVGQRHLFGT